MVMTPANAEFKSWTKSRSLCASFNAA